MNDLMRDERLGAEERRRLIWQVVACVALVLAFAPWGVIWSVASQSQIQPHVVVLDPQGHILWHGEPGSYTVEDVWVDTQIREWITMARSASDDAVVNRRWREKALGMTLDGAYQKYEQYLTRVIETEQKAHTHGKMRVIVHVKNVWKDSPTQYRVAWEEVWTPVVGYRSETVQLMGTFLVEQRLQAKGVLGHLKLTAADMVKSPLGIYVTFFDWAEVQPAS